MKIYQDTSKTKTVLNIFGNVYALKHALETVKQMQKTLQESKNWVKRKEAVDERNRTVDTYSSKACSFCLAGAMARADYEELMEEKPGLLPKWAFAIPKSFYRKLSKLILADYNILNYLVSAYSNVEFYHLEHFNDFPATGHKDILKFLDYAKKRLEEMIANFENNEIDPEQVDSLYTYVKDENRSSLKERYYGVKE